MPSLKRDKRLSIIKGHNVPNTEIGILQIVFHVIMVTYLKKGY